MLSSNAILEVKDLDVAYGHAKALHDVSLSIKQGETSFVIGRNGAGRPRSSRRLRAPEACEGIDPL